MTAISEREARTQYLWGTSGICAYSLKCASTFIHKHITGQKGRRGGIGQAEAVAAREYGTDVHLIVRHPLDRLVSNYVFWTKRANSCIRSILDADMTDHKKIMGESEFKNITIEDWTAAAHRHYNAHWYGQTDYHTTPEGILVPNILWPFEALKLMPATADDIKNKSPRTKPSWEDYFTEGFRREMEDYYAKDVELYEKSKEMWNGREAPTIL